MLHNIQKIFEITNDIPLFYVESGSRLWGIASPDSDYDVRGFHLQSKHHYFDFKPHRDIIEVMDGDFDFVSYDIDKMFGLLSKSNPTVFEWVRAHIIYFNALPDWQKLQADIVANFDFKALFHHYISLSKSQLHLMENDKLFTYKKTFYCIRGLLSADLATRQIIPALLIDDLFNQFETENAILRIAKESLERKKQKMEKESIPENEKRAILLAVHQFVDELANKAPESSKNRHVLDSVLSAYSIKLKSELYG